MDSILVNIIDIINLYLQECVCNASMIILCCNCNYIRPKESNLCEFICVSIMDRSVCCYCS